MPVYLRWGWRPAFVLPGLLGFIWLFSGGGCIGVRKNIHALGVEERENAAREQREASARRLPELKSSAVSCRNPGASSSRARSRTPVWFFITDWFAIYLVSKASVENT